MAMEYRAFLVKSYQEKHLNTLTNLIRAAQTHTPRAGAKEAHTSLLHKLENELSRYQSLYQEDGEESLHPSYEPLEAEEELLDSPVALFGTPHTLSNNTDFALISGDS